MYNRQLNTQYVCFYNQNALRRKTTLERMTIKMGKGNRVRTQRAEERQVKKESAKKQAAKAKIKHRVNMAISVILIVLLVAGLIFAAFKNTIDSHFLHSSIPVSTENYELNSAEMSYLFNTQYNYFLNQYGSMISYVGLDLTKSLKSQNYTLSGKENYTWYDYFLDAAKSSAQEMLVLCEEAKARGITLNDEDYQSIDETMSELKEAADEAKMSLKKYIEASFGKNVKEEDIRNCASIQQLAAKCYEEVYNEPNYSQDEIEKYCADNMSSFYFFDYKSFVFTADIAEDATDEEKDAAIEKASNDADALFEAATSEEAFDTFVEDYYRNTTTIVADDEDTDQDDDDKDDENTMTESELKEQIEKTLTTGAAYTTETDLGKWAFSQDEDDNYERKAGDRTIINDKEENTYTVYYLVNPLYRHEYPTKNAWHILITIDTYDENHGLPDEEAKAKADEILAEFKAGESTADAFGALAEQYTMDSGSKTKGGLYENITKGQMVSEFENWIYDESRKAGDTGVVKSTYGYHVMYFAGDGTISWQVETEEKMRGADYTEAYEALTEKYAVNYDDAKLQKLNVISVS